MMKRYRYYFLLLFVMAVSVAWSTSGPQHSGDHSIPHYYGVCTNALYDCNDRFGGDCENLHKRAAEKLKDDPHCVLHDRKELFSGHPQSLNLILDIDKAEAKPIEAEGSILLPRHGTALYSFTPTEGPLRNTTLLFLCAALKTNEPVPDWIKEQREELQKNLERARSEGIAVLVRVYLYRLAYDPQTWTAFADIEIPKKVRTKKLKISYALSPEALLTIRSVGLQRFAQTGNAPFVIDLQVLLSPLVYRVPLGNVSSIVFIKPSSEEEESTEDSTDTEVV